MSKMMYTHKEITQRDLDSIISANKKLKQQVKHTMGFNPVGILNNTIFKFLTQKQIDYITSKVEN